MSSIKVQSHYSVKSAAGVTGIGADNCIAVEIDEKGRMRADKLEEAILKSEEDGLYPFFVNATAGSTVYGAFDPLHNIADICQRHGLWMHVDVCLGE